MGNINELIFKGITDGRNAFIGPKVVQIDLTGRCNSSCIGCWVHSPFISSCSRDKNISLSFNRVRSLIEDLASLGTQEIYLAGAGEPFLHPDVMDIIEMVKKMGIRLNVITNFTLIDKKMAQKLIDLEVDLITASIWAGTADAYAKTHPGKTERDFRRVKENLIDLFELKARANKYLPSVKIYNVICNQNHDNMHQMIDFALDARAEFVEFQIMDVVDGETSFLALSVQQVNEIKEQFNSLSRHIDLHFKELESFNNNKETELNEFPGRFFKVPKGFFLKEWIENKDDGERCAMHSLVCPMGSWNVPADSNPLIEENRNKITFRLPEERCNACASFMASCPLNQKCEISFNYLKILGFGSFMRRINSINIYEQSYEQGLIDGISCYAGWIYSRVLSTGEVIPCCKSANKPLGNINGGKFLDIWNSKCYQEFRHNAKIIPKSNPYFNEINCRKSCDNIGINLQIKDELKSWQQINSQSHSSAASCYEGRHSLPFTKKTIVVAAGEFKSGNLNNKSGHGFGEGIVIDGGQDSGFAEYDIKFRESGCYELWIRYASEDVRPVELYFNGILIAQDALNCVTGGWTSECLRWLKSAVIDVRSGEHRLKIFTSGIIPHIHSFAFLKDMPRRPSPLMILKDRVRDLNHIISGKLINDNLDILGVFHGRLAFKGPFHVQIDLTNDCNSNCIACWCNSPLLEEKALKPEIKKQMLPFALVKDLLDELSGIGTKEIYFSGGGEPFIHPQIMEILDYAKRKGLICYINTNFTLMNKERIARLIDLGVDHLTVSVWAATAEIYAATHPSGNGETFRMIIENLKFLNKVKRKTPHIKLYNVIFSHNYHELKEMIALAADTGSESVEFTLVDTMPGKTDSLILNPQQIRHLQSDAHEIAKGLDDSGRWGNVLLFRFDSFLRRISSSSDLARATYDHGIIDAMPCYIGWCFSRVMPNGDVNACLKAHRIPVGNLYKDRFSDIWNGQKQRHFREKTLFCKKNDIFFRSIGNDPDIGEAGCYKSCDDIGRNIFIHSRIGALTAFERKILKIAAKLKLRPNSV